MCSYLPVNSHPGLINVRLFGYEPTKKRKTGYTFSSLWVWATVTCAVEGVPQCLQLVPLLQFSQVPPDLVEEVGALETAAVAVKADDDGAEAADQNRGPVHPELL